MARITWSNPISGEKSQFIADVLNESLFTYAFDSNKVPSLNLHYFCDDYLSTIKLVEKGIMKEGNMIPLNEEFESLINNSIWLPKEISQSVLYFKNNQGYYIDVSKDNKLNTATRSTHYKESAHFINGFLHSRHNYSYVLLEKIKEILIDSSFSIKEKKTLYFCVREFLSELLNQGIDKAFLYSRTREKLFCKRTVNDDVLYVMDFLKSLLPSYNDYSVVFGITDEVYTEMKDLITKIRVATDNENKVLLSKYVIETKVSAYDPISALSRAKDSFSVVLSIYNSCIHSTNIRVNPKGLVRLNSANKYFKVSDACNLLSKNSNKTKPGRERWLRIAAESGLSHALISSFELHNNALHTNEPQTQLLNLWTIFELLITTKQDSMSKVNYITNVLCSILCNVYYSRIISTLFKQITLTPEVERVINEEPRGNDSIEKFALILKDNTTLKDKLLLTLKEYPLEKYKIEYFSEIFSSVKNMREYLSRHSCRLRWQIMRIYRNRCMIVHNGDKFDYANNIIENLHYYVDELFDYVFVQMEKGVDDINTIISFARITEHENDKALSIKNSVLSDESFLKIVFNRH